MSPTQQLKHWQQILETLPTPTLPATTTLPKTKTTTEETTESDLPPHKRKTIPDQFSPEQWSAMSIREKRRYSQKANKKKKKIHEGTKGGGIWALSAQPPPSPKQSIHLTYCGLA